MIDVWHFYNGGGRPGGTADDLPAAGITAVQLNDGPMVHEDFLRTPAQSGNYPGRRAGRRRADPRSRRAGFTGPYCVEVNTPEFRNLPVAEAARRAADAAFGVLRTAGVMVP